ncbi:MAG: T9SS type A sorting domain-containing protein [Bacteroidota bacterium]|nr:T9SS type A sorting domain-containing protein [Bacteroidota bacterium]
MKKALLLLLCAGYQMLPAQNYLDRYLTDVLTYTTVGSTANQINAPRDLDVKPNTNEIWVGNNGTSAGGSFVIFYNAGLPNQSSQYRKDTHADHFDRYTSAFAFSDIGEFGTIGENQNSSAGSTFMGPSLWSLDTNIFARVFQNNWVNGLPLGSHLDMLHQSPYGMGIAHDSAKAYWVFDGFNGNICKYDYVTDHGPGYEDHSAGMIWRYTDVTVTRVVGVPSHMIKDKSTGWLYFIDGGTKELKRLNTNTGSVAGNLTPPSSSSETLAGYYDVQGAIVEVLDSFATQPCGIEIYNGRLLVGDYTNGNITMYDISGPTPVLLGVIATGQAGMEGIKAGPDGKIWFVNNTASTLVRIDASMASDDAAILSITSPVTENFETDFYSTKFTACSNSITPAVTLYNAGSNALTSAVITYTIDNGTPTNFNWTGSLVTGSSVTVSLPGVSVADGNHKMVATVSMPNAVADINNANDSKSGSFRSQGTIGSVPFFEGFSSTIIPAGWSYVNYNPNNDMSWNTVGGFGNSTGCVKMDNYSGSLDITGQKDYLMMPGIDMTSATNGTVLQFNVAYAKYNTASNDRLEVYASTDCGLTWSSLYSVAGTALSTAPISTGAFTPTASQWRQETISLNSYPGQADVRLMFVSVSNYGNNLYIDDVNILNTTGVNEIAPALTINVYPNPGDGKFFVETNNESALTTITVYNALGELVFTQQETQLNKNYSIDLSEQPSGMYLIKLNQGTSEAVTRVNIVH